MLSVTCKPHLVSVVMLNVVMLSVVAPRRVSYDCASGAQLLIVENLVVPLWFSGVTFDAQSEDRGFESCHK